MIKAYTEDQLDQLIRDAEHCGILVDMRKQMPRGPGTWPRVKSTDRIGLVLHQNGSSNFDKPRRTAEYHVSENNHIRPGGLPSTVYDIMIPDSDSPPWVTADFLARKYSHASKKPGDENLHLLAVLVMGGFRGPGYKGYAEQPSTKQLRNLEKIVDWLQFIFGFGDEGLFGHHQLGKASCPGYWGISWLEARKDEVIGLESVEDWQNALMKWNSDALPKYGADGMWGGEGKYWLSLFQKDANIRNTGFQDEITELFLMRTVGWRPQMSTEAEQESEVEIT